MQRLFDFYNACYKQMEIEHWKWMEITDGNWNVQQK